MNGVRSRKTVGGVAHDYVTQNGRVIQERYGTTVLQFVYGTDGNPYAMRYSQDSGSTWQTFYYILNLQGDVVKLVDANGAVCAEYSYDAWGKCLSQTTAASCAVANLADRNPIRYRGYYYDAETGWYYLQSRYYDPIVKRFINADSYAATGQEYLDNNMFIYCNNNPVSYDDRNGKRRGHAGAMARKKRKEAEEKYNENTINVYMEGEGSADESKLNVRFYVADADLGYININIDKSLEVTNVYEMYAVLKVIKNSEYYSEEVFGDTDHMMGQWLAHNMCYNFARRGRLANKIARYLSKSSTPIESSQSLDLRCKGNIGRQQQFIYNIILYAAPLIN